MSQNAQDESREATEPTSHRAAEADVGRVPFETPPSSTDEDPGDVDFPTEVAKK